MASQADTFEQKLRAGHAAFIADLHEYQIPKEILTTDPSGRYGIKGYADPELARMVAKLTLPRADQLLQLMHDAYADTNLHWDGKLTASEIYKFIHRVDHLRGALFHLVTGPQSLAYLLLELVERKDGNITRRAPHHGFEKYELGPTFKAAH